MRVLQSTVEQLLYILLLLVFISEIAIFVKLSVDDNRKFKVLRGNQRQLICIVKGFDSPQLVHTDFINNCIKGN